VRRAKIKNGVRHRQQRMQTERAPLPLAAHGGRSLTRTRQRTADTPHNTAARPAAMAARARNASVVHPCSMLSTSIAKHPNTAKPGSGYPPPPPELITPPWRYGDPPGP
jgi:hypothetical protein